MPASLVDDARETVEHLIRFATPSHSSNTAVTDWVQRRLNQSGFTCERLDRPDRHGVLKSNLVAVREPVHGAGDGAGLAYFAHTDVVPADRWEGPGGAFDPTVSDGRLYGRGACDMKGSLAAMLAAVQRVSHEDQTEPIWIVCTSDEETGFQGAKTVRRESQLYRQMVARQPVGIIGEPTRLAVVHAHKGITGFTLTSLGRAAHSSTREGRNANLAMVPLLVEIAEIYRETEEQRELWDERFDPPTLAWTFGVSDGCEAINVTPALSRAWVSLRPMPSIDGAALIERVREKASSLGVDFQPYDGGGGCGSPMIIPGCAGCARCAAAMPRPPSATVPTPVNSPSWKRWWSAAPAPLPKRIRRTSILSWTNWRREWICTNGFSATSAPAWRRRNSVP